MKQPRIEAVCQTVTDDNGSSKEVINITNKGGHIEGFHANVRTVITIHIDKWLLSENKTTIVSLTPKPLYLEVGYFDNNNTQYTNTKGDLIATIHAIDSSSKIDSLLQDTENEAAHEAGNYICTAFCDYTLIVTYLPAGNTEYYYVPRDFGTAFQYIDTSNIQNIINSATLNSFYGLSRTIGWYKPPTIDNLSGKVLWSWCKNQITK